MNLNATIVPSVVLSCSKAANDNVVRTEVRLDLQLLKRNLPEPSS